MDTRFDCGSWCWILRKSSAPDFGTKMSDFILSEGSCRAFFARLHILVTVRQCAIIGNKQFELRSSGVVKRSIDEASLYPDGNEF